MNKSIFLLIIACSFLQASSQPVYKANALSRITSSAGRWYAHEPIVDDMLGGAITSNNTFFADPLWYDFTIMRRYSDGLYPNNNASVAEWQYPQSGIFNDTDLFYKATMKVSMKDAYIVDSVSIIGIYAHPSGRPAAVVDTLIVAVAPEHLPSKYLIDTDSVFEFCPRTNLTGKIIASDSIGLAVTVDTFLLYPSVMGEAMDTVTGYYDSFQTFTFPVNKKGIGGHTGCAIPAGFSYAISVTFKSGDKWIPYSDSISEYNDFMMGYAYQGRLTGPVPMEDWYNDYNSVYVDTSKHDENMTSLLSNASLPYMYIPSIVIESMYPGGSFPTQYALISGHVVCATCKPIADVPLTSNSSLVNTVNAYPDPANDKLFIAYKLNENTDIRVSLCDLSGKTVKSETVKNTTSGNVLFSAGDLPSGLYFYTIKAGGQQRSGHVVIRH